MKIVRYLNDEGKAQFGAQHEDGSVTRIEGCIFSDHHDTGEASNVCKLLAPVKPAAVLCIGLNYRKHAEEGGAAWVEGRRVSQQQAASEQQASSTWGRGLESRDAPTVPVPAESCAANAEVSSRCCWLWPP